MTVSEQQLFNDRSAVMPPTAKQQTHGVQEIAEAVDMHPNSIRRNLQKGRIRGRKVGNTWVVTESALREWLGNELYEIHFASEEKA